MLAAIAIGIYLVGMVGTMIYSLRWSWKHAEDKTQLRGWVFDSFIVSVFWLGYFGESWFVAAWEWMIDWVWKKHPRS